MKLYLSEVRAAVHSSREIYNAALLKKGRFKEFLEEFYPLCCFGQSRFCAPDSRMHIVLGNQGFDAIIETSEGDTRSLEITSYIDGKNDFLDGQKIIDRGYGYPRLNGSKSLEHHRKDYLDLILKNAHKKSIRSYDDSDLLIVVSTAYYFGVFEEDDRQFVALLRTELSKIKFQTRTVFLLILNDKCIESIDENIYKIDFSIDQPDS